MRTDTIVSRTLRCTAFTEMDAPSVGCRTRTPSSILSGRMPKMMRHRPPLLRAVLSIPRPSAGRCPTKRRIYRSRQGATRLRQRWPAVMLTSGRWKLRTLGCLRPLGRIQASECNSRFECCQPVCIVSRCALGLQATQQYHVRTLHGRDRSLIPRLADKLYVSQHSDLILQAGFLWTSSTPLPQGHRIKAAAHCCQILQTVWCRPVLISTKPGFKNGGCGGSISMADEYDMLRRNLAINCSCMLLVP